MLEGQARHCHFVDGPCKVLASATARTAHLQPDMETENVCFVLYRRKAPQVSGCLRSLTPTGVVCELGCQPAAPNGTIKFCERQADQWQVTRNVLSYCHDPPTRITSPPSINRTNESPSPSMPRQSAKLSVGYCALRKSSTPLTHSIADLSPYSQIVTVCPKPAGERIIRKKSRRFLFQRLEPHSGGKRLLTSLALGLRMAWFLCDGLQNGMSLVEHRDQKRRLFPSTLSGHAG